MRTTTRFCGLVFSIALTLVPMTGFAAGERHTGTVQTVSSDSLVVDELGRAGKEHKLRVVVTPETRIAYSERNPHATSAQDLFVESTISSADVKKGDFVVVETRPEGKKLIAESITVTLRTGAQ